MVPASRVQNKLYKQAVFFIFKVGECCWVAYSVKAPCSGGAWMSPMVLDKILTVPVPSVSGSSIGRCAIGSCFAQGIGRLQSVRDLCFITI
uniref:Uncharacterized protein n=1 Tax=Anguilla anguilla TaxID=7936 RepID=A0A0E9X3E3_ANGAN